MPEINNLTNWLREAFSLNIRKRFGHYLLQIKNSCKNSYKEFSVSHNHHKIPRKRRNIYITEFERQVLATILIYNFEFGSLQNTLDNTLDGR